MLVENIKREVIRLKAKYQTDDPFELCGAMDIMVRKMPMGTHEASCKGFFMVNSRCKTAVINNDLPSHIQRIILPHELGHGVLHSSPAVRTFHEFSLFDETDRLEYEANIFASEFLLTDSDVLDALADRMDFFHTASMLEVPPELFDFKLRLLRKQGYQIEAPYIAHSNFLRRDIDKPLN